MHDGTDRDSGEECKMCVKIAELYAEPPNDVDIKMSISTFKNGRMDMIKYQPN